jgi:hypothetical protein
VLIPVIIITFWKKTKKNLSLVVEVSNIVIIVETGTLGKMFSATVILLISIAVPQDRSAFFSFLLFS